MSSSVHMSRSPAAQSPGVVNDRPELGIRVALFSLRLSEPPGLHVLLLDDSTSSSECLPSGTARPAEPLDDAARRISRSRTGVAEAYLEQLYTFSHFAGDGWLIIVSSLALASPGMDHGTDLSTAQWRDVRQVTLEDPVDRQVLDYALVRLRAKLGYTTIAFHLMPETFTLSELQRAYETILDQPLDKRNFRRRMITSGILEPTAGVRRAGSHRPAALYRFHATDDRSAYLTPR